MFLFLWETYRLYFRAKPIPERESFSGYLALFIEDILTFEFDDQVCEYLDNHPEFNSFLDTTYVQYKKESTSEFPHPKQSLCEALQL